MHAICVNDIHPLLQGLSVDLMKLVKLVGYQVTVQCGCII